MGSAVIFSGKNIAPMALVLLKIPRKALVIKQGNGRCNPALLSACRCNEQASSCPARQYLAQHRQLFAPQKEAPYTTNT